jgi:transmembrane sensor
MNPLPKSPDPIADAAAAWALKNDRGLTAAEQDEFSSWLAASAEHRSAYAEARWGWEELDRLVGLQTSVHAIPDPDLLAPPRRRVVRLVLPALALAAVIALGFFLVWPAAKPANDELTSPAHTLALIEQRELADGSVIELNRGALVTEHFTADTRLVRLARGEAHFKVAKDAARPFVVEAAGVAVRAVGTAFNVRLGAASVEVLVTEGKVRVDDAARGQSLLGATVNGEAPVLAAGQSATVDLAPTAVPQVATISQAEIEQRLAWQTRLLDFTDTPMPEIVAEFNRRNPVRLVLDDAELESMRLSAAFRSDNVDGFVRLMESDFGLRAEWRNNGEIILRRATH